MVYCEISPPHGYQTSATVWNCLIPVGYLAAIKLTKFSHSYWPSQITERWCEQEISRINAMWLILKYLNSPAYDGFINCPSNRPISEDSPRSHCLLCFNILHHLRSSLSRSWNFIACSRIWWEPCWGSFKVCFFKIIHIKIKKCVCWKISLESNSVKELCLISSTTNTCHDQGSCWGEGVEGGWKFRSEKGNKRFLRQKKIQVICELRVGSDFKAELNLYVVNV